MCKYCGKKKRRKKGRREREIRMSHMTTAQSSHSEAFPCCVIEGPIHANMQVNMQVHLGMKWGRLLHLCREGYKHWFMAASSPHSAGTENLSLPAVTLSSPSELSLKEPPTSLAPLVGDVHPVPLPVVSQKSYPPHSPCRGFFLASCSWLPRRSLTESSLVSSANKLCTSYQQLP